MVRWLAYVSTGAFVNESHSSSNAHTRKCLSVLFCITIHNYVHVYEHAFKCWVWVFGLRMCAGGHAVILSGKIFFYQFYTFLCLTLIKTFFDYSRDKLSWFIFRDDAWFGWKLFFNKKEKEKDIFLPILMELKIA